MNGARVSIPDRTAHAVLLGLAVWCVWRPVETFPSTAVLVPAVVLGTAVWAWRRTPSSSNPWGVAVVAGGVLAASGLCGCDPASAVVEISLAAAVLATIWLASREAPPRAWPELLAFAISALTFWAIWQLAVGMDQAALAIVNLPEEMQAAAAERLASGRAFASQILPSHLAVLFATALPILVVGLRPHRSSLPKAVGAALCVIGLTLTRSPVGAALALAACGVLALRRKKGLLLGIVLALVVVLAVAVMSRGDVVELKPLQLRLDNWRTALWVWSSAPATGVGIGGFAQAAQAVPFAVGNRPRHAHSLPLEWLAEFGPVGVLACALAGMALWRLLRRLWPERPELAVALALIPIHNLVDFSLYGSGVAVAWGVLLGWAVAIVRRPSTRVASPAPGRVAFVAAAALTLAATTLHVTSIAVETAAAGEEIAADRLDGALTSHRLAPWRVDPLGLIASAALDTGDPDLIMRAMGVIEASRWVRPRSAALASLSARLAVAVDAAPTAVAEAWTAASRQPANEFHATNLDTLLRRIDPGNRYGVP